jgi:hypothetical protein
MLIMTRQQADGLKLVAQQNAFIPDVMKLETDITGLQADVDAVFGGLSR